MSRPPFIQTILTENLLCAKTLISIGHGSGHSTDLAPVWTDISVFGVGGTGSDHVNPLATRQCRWVRTLKEKEIKIYIRDMKTCLRGVTEAF